MSNNPAFSTEQCAAAQHQRSIAASLENGMTVTTAFHIAECIVDKKYPCLIPAGSFVDDLNMVRPIRNRPERPASGPALATLGGMENGCLIHKEKRHVFQDGSVWVACSHSFCGFGKTHKRHSDGNVEPDEPEVEEPSEDTPQELSVPTFAKGSDESCEEDVQFEAAVEEAATEGEDEDEYGDERD
jgi:hypothetical protein